MGSRPFRRSRIISMTVLTLLLGLICGVLVGLLGIGGGVALVPAMVYLLHMDQHMAQGTSLFILLPPIGLGALREYWKQGQVDLRAGLLCALGMLVGAYAGSLIALPMASRHLKGLFGCFLMLSALLLWRKTILEGKGDHQLVEDARA
ncbi:MAG TPA: sulfite exporter TauE/SafE family protein [Candidatus Acidoferrum sp.]